MKKILKVSFWNLIILATGVFVWGLFQPKPIYAMSILAFIVCSSSCSIFTRKNWEKIEELKDFLKDLGSGWMIFLKIFPSVLLTLTAISLFQSLCIQGFPSQTVLLDVKGNILLQISNETPFGDMLFWKWNLPFNGNYEVFSYSSETLSLTDFSGPHSITENPKVRNIEYSISVEKYGSAEKLIKFKKDMRRLGLETSKEWLEYWLYEFNEAKSKELAKFYNPISQQKDFRKLAEEFLKPHFENAGVSLTDIRFDIPGNKSL